MPSHAARQNPQGRTKRKRLLRAAKISDYRFRRVLALYVRDTTATATAKATGLSINSTHAIFQKLRKFFYEVGLFLDFYDGEDPLSFAAEDPQFERDLLAFHLARCGAHRGLKSPASGPSYHFVESCWRFDFHRMMIERPSDAVYAMMEKHLLELIRTSGPVGGYPTNRLAGIRAVMRQADERIEWFARSAPNFKDADSRARLAEARAITEDS